MFRMNLIAHLWLKLRFKISVSTRKPTVSRALQYIFAEAPLSSRPVISRLRQVIVQ
jgi:hypothetical protein